jgi:hypothetical protein
VNGNNNLSSSPATPNKDSAPPSVPDNKVTVQPPSNLAALAVKINSEHREFIKAAQSAVTRGIACGEALISAKAQVKRGHWLRWLRENCIVAESTAQLYMKLAWSKGQLEEVMRTKSLTVGELTVNEALKLISGRREQDYEQPQPESGGDDSNGEIQAGDPLPVKLGRDVSEICKSLITRLSELRSCAEPQAQKLAAWAIEQVQETGLV